MNCRGFTLTELLVATLLLGLLTAGGLAAWARGGAAWHEASIEQLLQERAQYVFATLEPELQMAGYFGPSPPPAALPSTAIPAAAQGCGLELPQRLDQPVAVAPAYALPCAARGGGALPDSAQLTIRRVSAQLTAATAGRAQWLGSASGGRLVWNDAGTSVAGAAEERRDLLLRVYYVANQADGDAATPALRVKSLSSSAGAPALPDTEVMPGVQAMQAELLPTPDAPRSVRITLTLCPDQGDLRPREALRQLTITREYALRNAPPT